MKIQNIKKKKNGKYKLKLDNNTTIVTYDNVILNNNLLFNSNVDDNTMEKIKEENNYYDIYNEAFKFVSKKMRSEKEIIKYLKELNLDDDMIDEFIVKFRDNGIINDVNYTRAYIHDRMNFSNDGPFKIKEDLIDNGIDSDIIEDEFSKIDFKEFNEKCDKLILKKIKANHKYPESILKRKISNELFSLGYSVPNLDNYFINSDGTEVLKHEYDKLYRKYCFKFQDDELKNFLFQKLYAKGFSKENIRNLIQNI